MTWGELETALLEDIELMKQDTTPCLKTMLKLVTIAAIAHDKAKDQLEHARKQAFDAVM